MIIGTKHLTNTLAVNMKPKNLRLTPTIDGERDLSLYISNCTLDDKHILRALCGAVPEKYTVSLKDVCPVKLKRSDSGFLDVLTSSDNNVFIKLDNTSIDALIKLCGASDTQDAAEKLCSLLKSELLDATTRYAHNDSTPSDRLLISFFTDKSSSGQSLESIFSDANTHIDSLKVSLSTLERPSRLRKNENPSNTNIQNSENSDRILELNTKILDLEKKLAVSETVVVDAEAKIKHLRRNALFLGAVSGAASVWVSTYCLDKDRRITTTQTLAMSAVGSILGLIPYTRYATIALSPLAVSYMLKKENDADIKKS